MADAPRERKIVATNRRARYEYEILDTWEAGLVLVGPEVKSLREGNANLTDAYAFEKRGEVLFVVRDEKEQSRIGLTLDQRGNPHVILLDATQKPVRCSPAP